MGTWVDYKEIKQLARIDQVLTQYGVLERLKRKGENLVGPCPIHKGTNATQFHVSLAKNNFNCFGDCHGGGNVIDFVAKIEGIPIRDAALKLQEWFGPGAGERGNGNRTVGTPEANEAPVQSRPQELAKEKTDGRKNSPLTFALKHLDYEHPYLAMRGLTTKTIEEFGLGYCTKGLMKGRIAIPVHKLAVTTTATLSGWPFLFSDTTARNNCKRWFGQICVLGPCRYATAIRGQSPYFFYLWASGKPFPLGTIRRSLTSRLSCGRGAQRRGNCKHACNRQLEALVRQDYAH